MFFALTDHNDCQPCQEDAGHGQETPGKLQIYNQRFQVASQDPYEIIRKQISSQKQTCTAAGKAQDILFLSESFFSGDDSGQK